MADWEDYILPDESVLAGCSSGQWTWIGTDKRILKYTQNEDGHEKYHDLSYDEISGISLETQEYKPFDSSWVALGIYVLYSAIAVSQGWMQSSMWVTALGIMVITAITFGVLQLFNYTESYFQLRGAHLIEQEKEKWQIRTKNEQLQVKEFVKTVRYQIE